MTVENTLSPLKLNDMHPGMLLNTHSC